MSVAVQVTEQQLRAIFQPFGEIVYVKIPSGKGCGFVQFTQRSNAETAMLQLNGQVGVVRMGCHVCCSTPNASRVPSGGLHAASFRAGTAAVATVQSIGKSCRAFAERAHPAPQMVGNSSIRISWGRSSANRNAAGVALGMGMAGGFPQTGAFGRFGDSGGLAAAYGGFAAQAPGVIDPCALHLCGPM